MLIKAKEHKEIFTVEDGKKCWIENWETFIFLGYKIEEVEPIPFEELRKYPVGPTMIVKTVKDIVEGNKPNDIFYPEEEPEPEPEFPVVESLRGDYYHLGVRADNGGTDIPRLVAALKKMHAKDYMHQIWKDGNSWQDFQLMAPEFQKAGIRLWLYLVPPSEPPAPEPFKYDYVKWAIECANLAKEYPVIRGICIDDFNGNVSKFTPSYCKQMMNAARRITPHLALLAVSYYGYYANIAPHVKKRAIDGVVFPYLFPHKNHWDTSKLLPQIKEYRQWLDNQNKDHKTPLIVMPFAMRHSQCPDEPKPEYLKKCLEISLDATETHGTVIYCLPKDKPEFVNAVASVYGNNPENPYADVRGLLTLNPKPSAAKARELGFNLIIPYASKVSGWDRNWIPNTRNPWSNESKVIAYSMCDEPDCRKHDPQSELIRFREMKKKTSKPVGSVMCCDIGCGFPVGSPEEKEVLKKEWLKVVNQWDVVILSTYPYNTKWGQTPLEYMERFYNDWKQNIKIPIIVIVQAMWDTQGFTKPSAMYQVKYWVDRGYGIIVYPWKDDNGTGVCAAQDEWREALKYKKEG